MFSKRAQSVVRRISWITLLALVVSTACLVVVLSVMNALNQNVHKRSLALEPHLVVVNASIGEMQRLFPNELLFPFEDMDLIVRAPGGRIRGALGKGISVEGFQHLQIMLESLNEGKSYREDLAFPGEREVIIGIDLAQALGVFEREPLLLLSPESLLLPPDEAPPFELVRVLRVVNFRNTELDSQGVFYLQGRTAQKFSASPSLRRGVHVWLKKPEMATELKNKLLSHNPSWTIETWQERNSALNFALLLERIIISIFLGTSGLLAGFSIVSVLGLLGSQKKREFAVLRALGQSEKSLRHTFSWLGFWLGTSGITFGIAVGSLVSIYLEIHPLELLPEVYVDTKVTALWDPYLAINVLLIGIVFTAVISMLSAKSAIKGEIAENLRS